ncbi:hypothetical protein BJY52DRAFT_1291436, partial [Lactarius psammicola]
MKISKSIYWMQGCGKGARPTPFARGPRPGCALPSSQIPPVRARTLPFACGHRPGCACLARTPSYLCAHAGEHRRRAHAPPFAYDPRPRYAPPRSHTLPPPRACGDTAVAVQPSTVPPCAHRPPPFLRPHQTRKVCCARCGVWEPGCRGGALVCAKGGRACVRGWGSPCGGSWGSGCPPAHPFARKGDPARKGDATGPPRSGSDLHKRV